MLTETKEKKTLENKLLIIVIITPFLSKKHVCLKRRMFVVSLYVADSQ